MDLSKYIEYDAVLNRVTGEDALRKRLLYRLQCPFGRIPYYPRGLREDIFILGYTGIDIKETIADIVPFAETVVSEDRISVNTITLDLREVVK